MPTNVSPASTDMPAIYAKVTWRLIPFLFVCYIVAYLDRVNVGFAKLQMLADLKFSETVYGLGAGIFFIGYFLFEIPSNIILHKVGARVWIARIMIGWGLLSAAMVLVNSAWSFYLVRFLLGVCEAGFFPGIILYLTYWYPAQRRGRIVSLFMTAVALSGVVGGPISGWIMQAMSGVGGYTGWQWLFVLEAIPALLLGVLVLRFLDSRVQDAQWLSDSEKQLLVQAVQADNAHKDEHSLAQVLRNPRVWLCAAIYFCFVMGLYGVSFWLPTILKALGIKQALQIGLVSAIPWAAAVVCMVWVGHHSDRTRERRWHIALSAAIGGVGLALSAVWSGHPWLAIAALSVGTSGLMSAIPLFWSLPTAYLQGAAAAAGIALVNSFGNLAGFASPYAIGLIKDATHSTDSGMYLLMAALVLGGALVLTIPAKLVNR